MTQPSASPPYLSIWADTAAKSPLVVAINKVPATSSVRGALGPAGSPVTIQQVVVTQTNHYNYTPAELLQFPPNLRAYQAQHGYDQNDEEFRVDGSGPVTVSAGLNVEFHLTLAALAPNAPGIALATLTISVPGWDDINVPIQILSQTGQIASTAQPPQVDVLLAPGATGGATVTIASAPSTTSLIAHVESDTAMISLQKATASGGNVTVGAGQPLSVTKGEQVTFSIKFAVTTAQIPDYATGQLFIDSPDWAQTKIPLALHVGQLSVALSSDTTTAPIGASAEMTVSAVSLAGPPTTLTLDLPGPWTLAPASIALGRASRQEVPIKITPQQGAALGPHQVTLTAKGFDGLFTQTFPVAITVTPPVVTVTAASDRAVVPQNGSAAFQLKCIAGDLQTLTLTQGPAPPTGVSMPTVTTQVGPGQSMIVPVQFSATYEAFAPDEDVFPIEWATSDGFHQGEILAPISIQLVVQSKTFHHDITTAAALGGFVELTVRSDGSYTFQVHMNGSGIDPYAFHITVTIWAPDNSNTNFGAFCSGKVGGAVGSTPRDFDFQENSSSDWLKLLWTNVRDGRLVVTIDYDDTGVLGAIEDLAAIALKWLIANAVAGPVGATIVLGSELGQYTGVRFLHPALLAGALVAGSTVLLLGPEMLLGAVVAGAAAAAQIKSRSLRGDEIKLAKQIFGETLPLDRILVTNLSRGERAFCSPNLDGSIVIGLGGESDGGVDRYDDPLRSNDWRATLLHELTHSWQIAHYAFPEKLIWQASINETKPQSEVYFLGNGPYTRKWSDIKVEPQAVAVETYFLAVAGNSLSLDLVDYPAHPLFHYIQQNIRLGVP